MLHPEDKESGPEDLTIVTLSRTIVQCIYNDLGFLVGNRLIVLVEAQSTWSENILVRFLMYLGETYRRYIRTNGLRLYSEKNIEIPRPELYVVFTGIREEKPETISLRESFFHGEKCCVDVEAKVIYNSEQGDVINQYIIFCKVFNEQFRRYPADRGKAVQETIRICKERDVLKAYLEREEAAAVMFSLADQVDAMNEAFKIKWEEGKAEGIEEGIKEGQKTGEMNMLVKMLHHGRITVDEAAAEAGMSVEKFNKCAESPTSKQRLGGERNFGAAHFTTT